LREAHTDIHVNNIAVCGVREILLLGEAEGLGRNTASGWTDLNFEFAEVFYKYTED
jgi:hypothetical protein